MWRHAGEFAILIPAFNEGNSIGSVVSEARTVCSTVLVIDDGSRDSTGKFARAEGAGVMENHLRSGQGYSIIRGIRHLADRGFSNVLTLDGDGAHDPLFAKQLVTDHLSKNADLTIGSRFLQMDLSPLIPSFKVAANNFATFLVNRILNSELTDVASGMRVLGSRALQLRLEVGDFAFAYDLLDKAITADLKILESPIGVRYDARDMPCTNRDELVDLVKFLQTRSTESTQRRLEHLLHRIHLFEIIYIKLDRHFVLQPMKEKGGYLIQVQDPWFLNNTKMRKDEQWIEIS